MVRRRSAPESFGYVSRAERRAADLFFASLTGRGTPLARPPFAVALTPPAEEPPKDCGFFGPSKVKLLAQPLRDAIVAVARSQWTVWHGSGRPVLESEGKLFWLLVAYYLSADDGISGDQVKVLHANARAQSFTALLAPALTKKADIESEARRLQGELVKGLSSPTKALKESVETAITTARAAHFDGDPWSAAFVSAVVRGAAIVHGLETTPTDLLRVSTKHIRYVQEAWNRWKAGQLGTYHAFKPGTRDVSVGDIVVLDRRPLIKESDVTKLGATMDKNLISHGDIVVDRQPTHVVTVGGNVCHSVRFRHYPVTNKRLVVDRNLLFVQENSLGQMPILPAESCHDAKDLLEPQSTARVFAHLSLVEDCRPVP